MCRRMRKVISVLLLFSLSCSIEQVSGICGTQGSLRLVNGSSFDNGRLEICHSNEWGTVCDKGWTNLNAQVVCKQLGISTLSTYEGAIYVSNAYYGRGNGSVVLDNVRCTGTESTLLQCSHSTIGSSSCTHTNDVSVFCFSEIRSTGTIVLSRNNASSSSYYYGVVRVWYSSGWGNICDDIDYSYNEANVICHQLGYTAVSRYSRSAETSYGTDYLPMKWDDVDCSSSSYLSISQCSYSTFIDFGCSNTNSYDATVYCYFTRIWSNPFSGMIRLQGGDFSNQGRVEVYCNGQWGTICNAGFDSSDATTLCRQLGYDGYFTYNHLDLAGLSSQSIWGSNMASSSSDSCYLSSNSCPTTSISSCTHQRDVTLQCREIFFSTRQNVTRTTCSNIVTTPGTSDGSSTLSAVGGAVSASLFIIIIVAMCVVCGFTSRSSARARARRMHGPVTVASYSESSAVTIATALPSQESATKPPPPPYSAHYQPPPSQYPQQQQEPYPQQPYPQQPYPQQPYPQQPYPPQAYPPQDYPQGYPQEPAMPYPQQQQEVPMPYPQAYPQPSAPSAPPF